MQQGRDFMHHVALFPIPDVVSFPWVPCPLHVFEPRYRQMVRHCIDQNILLGVCNTQKVLHKKDREQTIQEALSTNQATYKPLSIFSAGPVQLLEEMQDGRMLIQVDNKMRLQLVTEKQTLPFSIWACEELLDQTCSHKTEELLLQSKTKILKRLLAITHASGQAQDMLNSTHWQTMPASKFSFAIAGILGMAPDTAQDLLEMTDPQQRLDAILNMINNSGSAVN